MDHILFKKIGTIFIIEILIGYSCYAQDSVSNQARDIEALKQGHEAILKELQEIKNILSAQRTPVRKAPEINDYDFKFELSNDLIIGDEKAKIILVNFTDYH